MEVSPSVLLGLQAASSSAIADTVFLGLMTRAIQAVLTDEGELQSKNQLILEVPCAPERLIIIMGSVSPSRLCSESSAL